MKANPYIMVCPPDLLSRVDFSTISPAELPTEATSIIAETLGVEHAIRIIDNFGGRSIRFTDKDANYRALSVSIGGGNAEKLRQIFAKEDIIIPTRRSLLKIIVPRLALTRDIFNQLLYTYCANRSVIYKYKRANNG